MSELPPTPSAPGELPPLPPPAPIILPYAQAQAPRPGIMTAIGIISICLGSLSAILSTCGVFQSVMYVTMRRVTQAIPPATTTPAVVFTPGATTAPVVFPFQNIASAPLVTSAAVNVLHGALALYLVTAGILLLRDRWNSRLHHLRYAVLKIIVVIPGAAIEAWSQYSIQQAFLGSLPQSAPFSQSTFMLWAMVGSAVVTMAFSLAYPITLLFVMRLRQAQAYYATLIESGSR